MLDFTKILTFFLGTVASFFVFLFFLAGFFESKNLHRFSRAVAFLSFSVAASLALIIGSPNDYSLPITAIGMATLYISLALDTHSHLKYTIFLPVLAVFFLRGHELLFSLSIMNAITLLELSYTTEHRKLIPFFAAFLLLVIAEYFWIYEPALGTNSIVSITLYLFIGFILLLWVIFYLARKTFRLFSGKD